MTNDRLKEDDDMRRLSGYAGLLLLAAALIAPVAFTGCSARASGTIKGTKATTPVDTGIRQASTAQQQDGLLSPAVSEPQQATRTALKNACGEEDLGPPIYRALKLGCRPAGRVACPLKYSSSKNLIVPDQQLIYRTVD